MRDLPYSQRVRRQLELMDRMMERLNVDEAFAAGVDGGLALHQARTKCIFCRDEPRCGDWLATAQPMSGPGDFCPNMEFFQDCLSEILRYRAIVPTD